MPEILTYREYQPGDFDGLARLWAAEAGWGELSREQFREWYVDIPDGPAMIVVGQAEDGRIGAMATLTPHRVALPTEIIPAARLAATVIASEFHANVFDLLSHPLARLLLACREVARTRDIRLLFGMPKHNWMSILKIAARAGIDFVPFTHFGCLELDCATLDPSARPFEPVTIERFDAEHVALWNAFRAQESITCAIHRDEEMLNFRNGGHRKIEFRDGSGELKGYAAIRNDGLLFDVVPATYAVFPDLLRSLASTGTGDIAKLKLLHASWLGNLDSLPLQPVDYRFGFVADPLDPAIVPLVACERWYVAGGG